MCLSGLPRGPVFVRRASSSLVALGAPVGFPDAMVPFSNQGGLAPPDLLGGCAGHVEAGREPGSLCPPLTAAEAAAVGSLRVVPVQGPAMELSLFGPSGVSLGLPALRWFACVDPVTDAPGFQYHQSFDRGLGWCTGAGLCGGRDSPFSGRRTRRPGPVRVCVCLPLLAGSGGRASWAHFGAPVLFLLPVSVLSLSARPPPGWGCPACGCCCGFFFLFCAPFVSDVPCLSLQGALDLGVLWRPPLFFFLFPPT